MEKYEMLVQFWLIPRDWNEAYAYAKAGAVSSSYYNLNR